MDGPDDFYEEDEPLADVIAAFEDGEKGRTAPRAHNSLGEYAAS